jgi:hypothetical protein
VLHVGVPTSTPCGEAGSGFEASREAYGAPGECSSQSLWWWWRECFHWGVAGMGWWTAGVVLISS